MRFETDIRDTAYGGYGVGTLPDGRVAMIPFTVEGDHVLAEIADDKKSFVYAELIEVIKPSEKRGEKYCPHIGICGGCSFGHIDYEAQKEIKLRIVKNAFRNIKCAMPESIISANPLRYRNRVTFKVKDGKLGFYGFKTRDYIEVGDCPLVSESLVKKCQQFATENPGKDVYELYAVENADGDCLASVKGLSGNDIRFIAFDGITGSDFSIGAESITLGTPKGDIFIGSESFVQSNRYLMGELQKSAEGSMGVNALELFCGSGFFTLALVEGFRSVTAVELSKDAVKLGQKLNLDNVRWVASDVSRFLRSTKGRFDHVFVDPPRTGIDKSTVKYIKENAPTSITYVSCNPVTLARDITRLEGMYVVDSIRIIDMFPNTHHVETVVQLSSVK